jgi:hypothetical protein
MAGPGDETAAAALARGHLRASHADREQVIETLKAAFVQGMLVKDEFDLRVGQTFASRTYAELAAMTADIPAGLATAKRPTPARVRGEQPVARPGAVIAAATAAYAGVWALALLVLSPQGSDNQAAFLLILLGALTYLGVLLIAAGQMVALRREKRSGERPPRRRAPGLGGPASQHSRSADQGTQRSPDQHGHQQQTEAARRRSTRLALPGRGSCGGGVLAAGTAAARC